MSDRQQLRRQIWVVAMVIGVLTWVAVAPSYAETQSPGSVARVIRANPMAEFNRAHFGQPQGVTPDQIIRLYDLPASRYAGAGQTLAIVDAYADPNIPAELAAFDRRFELPPCASACLTAVDENGGPQLPQPGPPTWEMEIALDIEWAHALAPAAKILLVEAASDQLPDLLAAERYAGAHAGYVSDSWGSPEFAAEPSDDDAFAAASVSYFAAAPDEPGQVDYPATSPRVLAVGGDEHTRHGAVAWPGSGGGCSAFESAPAAEEGVSEQIGCGGRTATPSASATATDIPIYLERSGWWTANGNSFATVLWAAAAADSGQLISPAYLYSHQVPLRPISGGKPLSTGMGDLAGPIRMTPLQALNMLTAAESAALSNWENPSPASPAS